MFYKESKFFLNGGWNFTGNALHGTMQESQQSRPAMACMSLLKFITWGGDLEFKLTAAHTTLHSLLYHPHQELLNQFIYEQNIIKQQDITNMASRVLCVLLDFQNL